MAHTMLVDANMPYAYWHDDVLDVLANCLLPTSKNFTLSKLFSKPLDYSFLGGFLLTMFS